MSDEYILDDVIETIVVSDDLSDDFLDGLKDVGPDGGGGQSGDNVQLDAKGEPLLRDLRHESTVMSDIRNNPVKWLLSLAVVGPGMAYTITEQTSYAYRARMDSWYLCDRINFHRPTVMLLSVAHRKRSIWTFYRHGRICHSSG